ncbi:MAG: ImmA/IrrE family metallo-endopeptidase [Firmicutes bacterium]|nr:ImmA/IrrE family metallo-endopeptidase [Bacillota bacterium]
MKLEKYIKKHTGLSVDFEERKTILYSDSLSYSESNLVIAHEIGHIVLGHTANGAIIGKINNLKTYNKQEQEADIFALEVLSPSPVLAEIKVHSPIEISCITGIPLHKAEKAAVEVSKEENVKCFGIKRELIEMFRPFIEKNLPKTQKQFGVGKQKTAVLILIISKRPA